MNQERWAASAAVVLMVFAISVAGAQAQGTNDQLQSGTAAAPQAAQPMPAQAQPMPAQAQPMPAQTQPAPAPVAPPAPARPALAKNSIYLEGLGAGGLYSINYEHVVIDQLALRIGFSYLHISVTATSGSTTSTSSSTSIFIPITLSYIGVRAGSSALEIGAGPTIALFTGSGSSAAFSSSGSGATAYGTVMVGYRLHPVGHAGFQFRIGAMAMIGKGLGLSSPDPTKIGFIPWGYISFGASF